MLDAGYKHNVIPDRAEALVDIRTLPGEEEAVLAEVRALIGDDIEIEIVHRDVGLEAPTSGAPRRRGHARARRARSRSARVPVPALGRHRQQGARRLGIAGYGFAPLRLPDGFDFPAMFHGVDERVPLDALVLR